MATAKKPVAKKNTSLMRNPGSPHAKKSVAKRPAAKKNSAVGRPATKRKTYRRNPSPAAGAAMFVIGAVVSLKAFELAFRFLAPANLAAPVSIGVTAALAFGVGKFGGKVLPSAWATIASTALWLKVGLDIWDEYVERFLPPALGGTAGMQPVAQVPVQDGAGNTGTRMFLADGETTVDVFENAGAPQYAM